MPKSNRKALRQPRRQVGHDLAVRWSDLQILNLIFASGGIQRASVAINMTRTALERRVLRLEKLLDAPLLNRSSADFTLSPEAQRLVESVGAAYAAAAQAISDFATAASVPHVGLARETEFSAQLFRLPDEPFDLSKFVEHWWAKDDLTTVPGNALRARDQLLKKRAIVGNISENNIEESAFSTDKLFEFSKRVIAALASGKSLTVSESDMPEVSISKQAQSILAARLANDLGRAARDEPLELPSISDAQDTHQFSKRLQTTIGAAIDAPPLPKRAPARWDKHRIGDETAVDFVKRNYAPWLGRGLHRGHIAKLDAELYEALRNYMRWHQLPDDCPLPTVREHTDQLVASVLGDFGDAKTAEDVLRRLGIALSVRKARHTKGRNR